MFSAFSHLNFPPELPVSQRRDDIAAAILAHQVVIVAGETGSGKTTQLPKICLALGRTRIAHTQPRRLAARTIAERIAEELGSELGDTVGYQVRFADTTHRNTKIRLITDGILLHAIHRDRELAAYDTIIIDEAHERSLNIDFLLGYLRTLLPRRPDLKVIITSATIDPESFAKHFADADGTPAPIIEVSGRTYPVELRYRPFAGKPPAPHPDRPALSQREVSKGKRSDRNTSDEGELLTAIGDAVEELSGEAPGDVLVFLSGEAEIRDAIDALRGRLGSETEILPLYGRLSAAEQHRVFEPKRQHLRRVVLATNVAETSLTVPGIRYVIDSGTARISRYNSRSKVQRLPIEAISQASARQRAGRAGRLSAGIAIRLYSEQDFQDRPAYTEPEILRTGLASVMLQMLALGLGSISDFPFLTPPDTRDIRDGLALLQELGAVTRSPEKQLRGTQPCITRIGRELARLPIEPRFARMIIEARRLGVIREVIAIVAGLTVQDVRERPAEQRDRANQLHARFADPMGDAITLLNLWNYLREQQQARSSSAFRRMCRAELLSVLRVREWMDLVRQLERVAGAAGPRDQAGDTAELVHRAMLAGLLSHLGVRDDRQRKVTARVSGAAAAREKNGRGVSRRTLSREYFGARGTRFVLHPGSTLATHPPEVVMSVELVETSRLYARGNAAIDPAWAEELAGELAKRSISEPHWSHSQGAALAYERLTLYGLTIVPRRTVQLARFNLPLARELFITHALVAGDWQPQGARFACLRANRRLRQQLQEEELRRRQIGAAHDDELAFTFYDARIPAEIASARDFEGWWKRVETKQPTLLTMRRDDLLPDASGETGNEQEFPREWRSGEQRLELRYRFDPGADDDGVTVAVPLPLLPGIEEPALEQLVPGLREELVTALIRSLPKRIRTHVVPAADWARTLLAAIEDRLGTDSLATLLSAEIRRRTSVQISANDFDFTKLPAHLTPTFRVLDERGRTLGTDKNLAVLKQTHRERATQGIAGVVEAALPSHRLEQTGLTSWSFGDLPTHLDLNYRGGTGRVRAYPALIDRRSSVELKLVATAHEQARLTRRGIRRLLLLSSPSPASYLKEHLSNQEALLLSAGPYRSLDHAIADVSLAIAEQRVLAAAPDRLIWQAELFERVANDYARALFDDIFRGIALTAQVLEQARRARKAIDAATAMPQLSQLADAKSQLHGLVWAGPNEGFVSRTGLTRLERLPVYLQAIQLRMQQLSEHPGRDRSRQRDIDAALELFQQAGGEIPLPEDAPAQLLRARWLIEELRVSLFAQQLRTAEPASLQRLQKVLQG